MSKQALQPGMPVQHAVRGRGVVEYPKENTALVRFGAQIEECLIEDLALLSSPDNDFLVGHIASPATVVWRLQAECIRSINDTWGLFSPSRINLYPHQLWVCRNVTAEWPVRWVVADDVGLGKTIEAGLILWRLLHLGLVKRLLVLCPASLVEQWQERLFNMFDIRTMQYDPRQDKKNLDFWRLHPYVVASFHTLRDDRNGRHERMLAAEPWDLLIVDEAHHLNYDEASGMTLSYRLIKKLQDAEQLKSMLLFTGTPHRGKHFGFLALMALVRPDLFDPRKAVSPQMPRLSKALIRNNKYHVTNLKGERLFKPPIIENVPYSYHTAEDYFYETMTEFISSGRAYATRLDGSEGRAVMLVLIALQKLASSSIAAVKSALVKRRDKLLALKAQQNKKQATKQFLDQYSDDEELLNQTIEDTISALTLELVENECERLSELIQAADAVRDETKIRVMIEHLRTLPADESVLFFTEYKVTQALLVSALYQEFGVGCAGFINGDNALTGVYRPDGKQITLSEHRQSAKDRFNEGQIRFLVSTEAAGEGIDLQIRCSRLIHVDLPWNPMRLHQRVGRLNRIGQTRTVKVMLFQNPETVEYRIWSLLNEKLERIKASINAVTEEPEDLHQLVLGVNGPGDIEQLFAQADHIPPQKLTQWFDQQTGQMGGEDVVKVVQDLLGHAQHFDFAQVSEVLPPLDLEDLEGFFKLGLRINRRQIQEQDGHLAFKTPESWQNRPGLLSRYQNVHFQRVLKSDASGILMGVGNRLFDAALEQALALQDNFTELSADAHSATLFVYRFFDRVTGNLAQPASVIAGVLEVNATKHLLRDWQVFELLNQIALTLKPGAENEPPKPQISSHKHRKKALHEAELFLNDQTPSLALSFVQTDFELLSVISGIDSSLPANLRAGK